MKSIAIISKDCLSVLSEVGAFVAALLVCVSDRCDTTRPYEFLDDMCIPRQALPFQNPTNGFFFSELTTGGFIMQSSKNFRR